MWYAEYWDDEAREYVSECFAYENEEACRDWCFEHQIPYYTDEDGNEYYV